MAPSRCLRQLDPVGQVKPAMPRLSLSLVVVVGLVTAACAASAPDATIRPSENPTPLTLTSAVPSASPSCLMTTTCGPSSADPIDTANWVPFTSERYGYTVAHPPSWTATPATRAWDHERSVLSQSEGSDQIGGSSAYVLSSAGYLIWFSAFAVDVPAGTSEERWMADYSDGPGMARFCSEYADAEQRPITVDGQPGTMIVGDPGCWASAFVFFDGRVHGFELEGQDLTAMRPEWQPLRTALLEAFLGTVEFQP